ncbi:nuclear envelope pore membrane protein POM 121 isoform X2 [Hypanus sabinus]|uniref:nuclear envelope pore membrane protein POM 121 isoform X2 n=1 Tax=Hypanus sabinus TaxID=79690 RepID=UPI0028C47676|nr:nuclear envelope pore membrane protein POM 121 isoform X2 [Hypanus sabinus]
MSPAHKRSLITWVVGLGFALLLSFYVLGWYLLGLLAAASAWFYYSSLPSVGPAAGPLFHPSRIRAFLLGTRWAEVLYDKLNGGRRQWNGRDRSARSRSQQGLRNPSKAPGNNWKWEVNCEEREPLLTACASERSPANLMMGSYLSNESTARAPLCGRELKSRYGRPNLIQSPTRRLTFGEHQGMLNKFTVTPRRRYPIHQPQYSIPGTLPTVRWDGYQKKNVLSSRNSIMVHSPVTVKIARPDASIIPSPLLDQMMSPAASPLVDPCSKATVLNALKESRKRMVEDDPERSLISEHENKRRRHDSSGSGHSAFEPLLANGAPASLVPKPGTLKRGTNSQCSDDPISKRSRTSSISSLNSICVGRKHSSVRNPIFSSYSSTRGQIQGLRCILSARNTTPLSSPASSRSETPERSGKKIREEEVQRSNASTPVRVDRPEKDQSIEEETATPTSKCSPSTVDSSPLEGDVKRKRKIPLLPKRKGNQLTMHPPIEIGYTITAEDMDSEKKARLDRIKKVLQEKEEPSKSLEPVVTVPSVSTFTTPAVESSANSTPISTSISAIVSNSLLDSLKMMQGHTILSPTSDSVNGVNPSNMAKASEASTKSSKSELSLSSTIPAPTTSAVTVTADIPGSKAADVLKFSSSSVIPSLLTPVNNPAPKAITTTTNSCQFSVLVSAQETKLSKGPEVNVTSCTGNSSTPSTSFTLSSTATAIPTEVSTTVSSSVSIPKFKPVFGPPVTQQSTITPATLSSGMPLSTTVSLVAPVPLSSASSIIPFKPVFGNSMTVTTTATTTAAPFNFGQSVQAVFNKEAPPPTTSTKSNSTLFQFGATTALTSSSIDSEVKCSKATVSFGLNETVSSNPNVASTLSNNLSSQQQFQFGSNPTTTTTTAAPSTVFQFGKTSADATATSASLPIPAFGQPNAVTSQASTNTAATSNIFGNFTPSVSAPSTTSSAPLTLAFGNSGKTSLFGNTTSAPPFGALTTQLNFGGTSGQSLFGANATATQQTPSKAPAFGSSGAPFSFGSTPTNATFQSTTSQSAFATPSQPAFGVVTAQTAFGSTSKQSIFGGGTVGFSFGTTTSSTAAPMFSATKSSGSSTTGSIFGSTQGFGSSSQPAKTTSGFNVAAPNPTIATAGFFSSGQGGFCASNPSIPFATTTPTSSSSQNMFGSSLTNQGTQNQTNPQFSFGAANAVENKSAFGGFNFGTPSLNFETGTTAPGFGQGTPSASFSFGATNTPAANFGSPATGTAAAPAFAGTAAFSIGAGSRPAGGRQRLLARRQHTRKR